MDVGDIHQLVDFIEIKDLERFKAFIRMEELLLCPVPRFFPLVQHRVDSKLFAHEHLASIFKRPFNRIVPLPPLRIFFGAFLSGFAPPLRYRFRS